MTAHAWARLREGDEESRTVKRTRLGRAVVLTLWAGVDPDPGHPGPARIFTTATKLDGALIDETFTPTESGALAMHAFFVELARSEDATWGH